MRCGECPVWPWAPATECWPTPLARALGLGKKPYDECCRSVVELRREATRLRCIADALDQAAEMREREEAQPHA